MESWRTPESPDNLRSSGEREGTRFKESGGNFSRLDETFLHRHVHYKHQGYAIIIMAGARGYIVGLEIKAKEFAAVVSKAAVDCDAYRCTGNNH